MQSNFEKHNSYLKRALLCSAIESGKKVQFHYGGNVRLAEPYCLYQRSDGTYWLTGYLVAGFDQKYQIRQWLEFALSGMTKVGITDNKFKPRSNFTPFSDTLNIICNIDVG